MRKREQGGTLAAGSDKRKGTDNGKSVARRTECAEQKDRNKR